MGQILIRQIDDMTLNILRARARASKTSVEALAREAIRAAAAPTVAERQALVRDMQARYQAARIAGVEQTPGWQLIREGRDER